LHFWGVEGKHTRFWWGNLKGRKPLGERWRRLEDNVQMYRKETRFEDLHWINFIQNRGGWRSKLCDYGFIVLK